MGVGKYDRAFCEFALTIQYARGHSAVKKSNILPISYTCQPIKFIIDLL